jgi:hypothetical protein
MSTHRTRTPFIGIIVTLVTVAALVGASASGLGLTASSITASSVAGISAAAPKVTCDNFTGNGNMNGRAVREVAACGAFSWSVHRGNWNINSNQARRNGNTSDSTVTVAAGSSNRMAQVDVFPSGGASVVAGLTLAHNGTTLLPRYLAVAIVGTNTVQLRYSNGLLVTTLASASASISNPTRLRASLSGGTVRVWVNGTLAITHNLSALQQSTISGGSRYGLYSSGGSSTYDNFHLTQVWP